MTPNKSTHVAVKCGRCDGKGAIASFSVKFSGKCFACGGSGTRWLTRAAYEKKKCAREERDAYFAAQRAANPICKACGYAVSGPDSWDGTRCKCAINGAPRSMNSVAHAA